MVGDGAFEGLVVLDPGVLSVGVGHRVLVRTVLGNYLLDPFRLLSGCGQCKAPCAFVEPNLNLTELEKLMRESEETSPH